MKNALLLVREKWNQLAAFSKKEDVKDQLWKDIVDHYSGPYRYYHNLHHIASLFEWSDKYLSQLKSPAVAGFSILYHDIIYDTFKDNNEELSAAKAKEHLQQLNVKNTIIQNVEEFILATKAHSVPQPNELNNDLSYFLDFDLAILGTEWDEYEEYSQKIRKEYRQYPDNIYNPGRKHALKQLSEKQPLYFTQDIKEQLEETARKNTFREMQLL